MRRSQVGEIARGRESAETFVSILRRVYRELNSLRGLLALHTSARQATLPLFRLPSKG
jgi:hypothetical protein